MYNTYKQAVKIVLIFVRDSNQFTNFDNNMNFPDNILYSKDHEWILVENETATIGITDFAQSELGDIVYVDINKKIGNTLQKDEVFGTVEAVKTVSDLYSPASGELLEINDSLNNYPEDVNKDCYEKGWMIKIKLIDKNDLSTLLSADAYRDLIGK